MRQIADGFVVVVNFQVVFTVSVIERARGVLKFSFNFGRVVDGGLC